MDPIVEAEVSQTAGRHHLYRGDCLTIMPALEPATVDVMVTSPPCNLDVSYRGYVDRRTEDDYLDWLVRIAGEVRRLMEPNGSFFLNLSGSSSGPWLPFELIVRLRPLFVLQNYITWIKSITTRADSVGHFKPIAGQRFLHHNSFPLNLPRWCSRLHGREDALVLDSFTGLGTTVLAAALEGARGIGIDVDPTYVATARARLAAIKKTQQSLAYV